MDNLTYIPTLEIGFINKTTNSNPSTATDKVKNTSASEIYEGIFQHAFHAMYVETPDGSIMKFNEQFCKLFGYSTSEMNQVENTDLFEREENSFINFLDQRNDKGIATGEITGIKKSGKRFPCRISSVVYKSDFGDKRTMNTIVDISDDLSARWNFAS